MPRYSKKRLMDSGLRLAIRAAAIRAGVKEKKWYRSRGKVALAEGLGIKVQSINAWKRIPRDRVMMVHIVTGLPLSTLAPDLFKD